MSEKSIFTVSTYSHDSEKEPVKLSRYSETLTCRLSAIPTEIKLELPASEWIDKYYDIVENTLKKELAELSAIDAAATKEVMSAIRWHLRLTRSADADDGAIALKEDLGEMIDHFLTYCKQRILDYNAAFEAGAEKADEALIKEMRIEIDAALASKDTTALKEYTKRKFDV